MLTTALTPYFGVEIHDINLLDVTAEKGYAEIREHFERHSLLLFRGQQLDDEQHNDFAALFGPLEDRNHTVAERRPPLPKVSNLKHDGDGLEAEDSIRVLDLKANQLWHTDSTFLPTPALANVIAARVVPSSGGETEIASTRAAWKDFPSTLKQKTRSAVLVHRLRHSRQQVDATLAVQDHIAKWTDQRWRAVWRNPVTGDDAVYVASHAAAVEGFDPVDGRALIDELIERCTQPEYVYRHQWRAGDVLVWDERATLHRGRPWPYNEERTMASCCVSAQACDGVEQVRPAVASAN